jgi:hypothetical protein
MKNDKIDPKTGLVSEARRSMLKVAAATGLGLPVAAALGGGSGLLGPKQAKADDVPRVRESYWTDDYFVQESIDASGVEGGIVRARVDGEWKDFVVRELGDDFVDWNFQARIDMLSSMGMPCLDGPHSGCLATYGTNRGDSSFSINSAFKGFGFFPLPDRIDAATETLQTNWNADITAKAGVLRGFYRDRTMWDFHVLSSLELYSSPTYETHSFLNQMANPQVSVSWLAIPGAFEVRAIAHLMHPKDPNLTDLDKKRLLFVNLMHDFYHGSGGTPPTFENITWIGLCYYIVEVFDNSPDPGRMGQRSVPPL